MEYYLNRSYLTELADNCIARTSEVGSSGKNELITDILKKGKGRFRYEYKRSFKCLKMLISASFKMNLYKHNFKTSSDLFIERVLELTTKHRGDRNKFRIDIFSFKNHSCGILSTAIYSGSIGELRGEFLKLDASDVNQGIFLIAEDGTEYRVGLYVTNTNSKQVFQIPGYLTAGDYDLELRTFLNPGKLLQKARLSKTLIIH